MAARSAGEHPRGAAGVRDGGQSGPAGGRVIAFRTRVSDSSELEKGNPVVPGTNPVSAIAAHAGDGKPNWESHGDRSLSARTDRQSLCDATTDRDRELPLASHGRC